MKAISENKAEMVEAHKEAGSISLENQKTDTSPIPFHPGAVEVFAEGHPTQIAISACSIRRGPGLPVERDNKKNPKR